MRKLTIEEVIERARAAHGDRYGYSDSEYLGYQEKMLILCMIHGIFWQTPDNHFHGKGCSDCNGGVVLTKEIFIEKANKIHNNKYDYSNVDYKGSKKLVEIICKTHGSFFQIPSSHLRRRGCKKCAIELRISNTEEFIEKANECHNYKYDYKNVNYTDSRDKVEIICKFHGLFLQTPNCHLQGKGCPDCKNYIKENICRDILQNLFSDKFRTERPDFLRNILTGHNLELDCYNENLKLALEYNGKQHYEFTPHFHKNEEEFNNQLYRDELKKKLCKENDIYLITVPYTIKEEQLGNYISNCVKRFNSMRNNEKFILKLNITNKK